jgi:uncharacterized protein (TIGR02271 family)
MSTQPRAPATDAQPGDSRAQPPPTFDLVEEELSASTRPVQTGEVTIRREVVTEPHTIEVPTRRQELLIERQAVERRVLDRADMSAGDPLIDQLIARLQQMGDGETLRIPIIEEEVVVTRRPVVVEEIIVRKRSQTEIQTVADTIRREELRVEERRTP